MSAYTTNRDLIGQSGSRLHLDTPALVLDLDAFERNLDRMATWCRNKGLILRAHAKTHKCVAVAKAQIARGAQGICCAKLGEAEALADGGIDDILLTSPVVGPRPMTRLMALNRRLNALAVVADDPDGIAALDDAAKASGKPLTVLIDLDAGQHRTGARLHEAVDLVRQVDGASHLTFGGLQAYMGHLQHIHDRNLRAAENAANWQAVANVRAAIEAIGIACPVVTGGGTGTHDLDAAAGVLTELQAGSYIFMDREYGAIDAEGARLFEPALYVYTRVISRNQKAFVTTDAGFKAFATDGPFPAIAAGVDADAGYVFQGDEHGAVIFGGAAAYGGGPPSDEALLARMNAVTLQTDDPNQPETARAVPLGHLIACVVPHCDPTVNLYDAYHCVRGDTLVDIWPIEARGRSQ